MTSIFRFLLVTGCMVQLLFVSTAFATADRKRRAEVTGYCFRHRTPIGQRGRCTDEIRPSDQTTLSGANDCCLLGGVGWTTKTNGKRCENACKGEPNRKDVQSLETVTHNDKTDFRNDSNNATNVLWSEWGDWQNCTASCGVGNMTRYRTCNSTEHCNDSSQETIPCNSTIICQDSYNATNVLWSEWGDWQNCTASCGVGNMTRYRTCNSTEHCNGSSQETIPCNSTISCQDIGNATWSVWGDWQNCTAPCGVGNMTRYRTCNGGENCSGSSEETIVCDSNITCQVNGRWTAWSDWSNCNPCDSNAKTTRSRSCTNPPPSGGGSGCVGLQSMTRNCPGNCPDQNNGWSEWSDWTDCSAPCGKQGFTLRSRSCNRTPPQTCPGNFLDYNTCTTHCPTSR